MNNKKNKKIVHVSMVEAIEPCHCEYIYTDTEIRTIKLDAYETQYERDIRTL